jgi:putative ABC transport system permease protein
MGSFFSEVTGTFALIANIIGGIALLVAAVTVFIITFINAVTRRKFIGILKGIGVTERSIEIAYVLQAVFYALVGIGVGVAMILVLDPYFDKNPIDFPFSDGILSVTTSGILIRSGILLAVTFIAGYLPARRIVHGNTLDAILGR